MGVKAAYGRREEALRANVARYTRTVIATVIEARGRRLKTANDQAILARGQSWITPSGDGKIVEVETNQKALAKFRAVALDAIATIHACEYRSLGELRDYIRRVDHELNSIDLQETSKTEAHSGHLRDTRPESPKFSEGVLLPGGDCVVISEPAADRMARRIDSLKKELPQ